MIYLDYNATTPVCERALLRITDIHRNHYGNPSSLHEMGRKSRSVLSNSRALIAKALDAEENSLFFTSGGTESNNAALWSAAAVSSSRGRKKILYSAIEHHSVLDFIPFVCAQFGMEPLKLPVDRSGTLDVEVAIRSITEEAGVLALMHSNNETGAFQPVEEIISAARDSGLFTVVDAVQSFGKSALSFRSLGCDYLTVSAHKIYGPKGTGAILIKEGVEPSPFLKGGHQERNIRPGTEALADIAGFAAATEEMTDRFDDDARLFTELRSEMIPVLKRVSVPFILNESTRSLANTISVTYPSVNAASVLMALDLEGVQVSTGSACAAGSAEPSHVIMAMTGDAGLASSTIRISTGRQTTTEEVVRAAGIINHIVERISGKGK